MMRLLIDTNMFIYRENYHVIPSNLQFLLKTLNTLAVQVLVHPLSVQEIERDKNQEGRKVISSRIRTYPLLDNPPHPETDQDFLSLVGQASNLHEVVDISLLCCVYKNAVHFLLTEDGTIRRKSGRLGVSDRVFGIDEALEYFKKQLVMEEYMLGGPLQLEATKVIIFAPNQLNKGKETVLGTEIWSEKITRW